MKTNEQMRNVVSLDTILDQLSEEKVQLVTVVAGSWVSGALNAVGTYFDSIVDDAAYLIKEFGPDGQEVTVKCKAGTNGAECEVGYKATWN